MKELNRFRQFLEEEQLNEASFGDDKKAALENSLTGMAKAMVEDGTLFADGGNVIYDEAKLKDGATPEQIEAIDQIKAAVIKMGDEVQYGDSDEDGTITYTYLIGDKAQLIVMTRDSLNENKADVFDYADRIMGAGEPEDIDLVGLVDFYAENPDDIPEPMDAEIFIANKDAIRDRVADYVAMMSEGEDELDEGLLDKVIQKLKDKRAAKKEKERFTKGLDMKDFRGKGPVEIEPEFTAGLEEADGGKGMYQEIDAMIGSIKDQMSPDDAFDSLVSEFEAISGGTKLLHRALKNITLDNNIPE